MDKCSKTWLSQTELNKILIVAYSLGNQSKFLNPSVPHVPYLYVIFENTTQRIIKYIINAQ